MPAPSFGGKLKANLCAADAGVANGAVVTSITDRRGGGAWAQATSGREPVYSAAGGLNGKPALVFDGVNDCLVAGAWAQDILNGKAGATLVVVATYQTLLGTTRQVFNYSNATAGETRLGLRTVSGYHRGGGRLADGGTYAESASPASGSNTINASLVLGLRVLTSTGAIVLNRHGASTTVSATGTLAATGATFGATSSGEVSVGGNTSSAANATAHMTLVEVLLYDERLSDAEMIAVNSYLQDEYAVTAPTYDAAWAVGEGSVSAGADQSVQVDSGTVTLTATGSPGGGTYAWTQTSGTTVTLSGASTATATYPAPSTPGARTFQVAYTPSGGSTFIDTVTVTHTLPAPPTASHTTAMIARVDATASTADTSLTYVSGPEPIGITEPTTDVYEVELPETFETNMVLTLTTTDAYGQSTQQTVTITPVGAVTVLGGVLVNVDGVYV